MHIIVETTVYIRV